MSNSDMFTNNLQQTNINDAYKFETFSDYINNKGLKTNFSPNCIFCSLENFFGLLLSHNSRHLIALLSQHLVWRF